MEKECEKIVQVPVDLVLVTKIVRQGRKRKNLRRVAKTVVIGYCFDAARASDSDITVFGAKVNSNHGHRGHAWCFVLYPSTTKKNTNDHSFFPFDWYANSVGQMFDYQMFNSLQNSCNNRSDKILVVVHTELELRGGFTRTVTGHDSTGRFLLSARSSRPMGTDQWLFFVRAGCALWNILESSNTSLGLSRAKSHFENFQSTIADNFRIMFFFFIPLKF